MNRQSPEFKPRWYHRKRAIIGGAVLGLALTAGAPFVAEALTNPPSAEEVKALEEAARQHNDYTPEAEAANSALAQAYGAEASPEEMEDVVRGLGLIVVLVSGISLVGSTNAGREFANLNTPNTTGPQ